MKRTLHLLEKHSKTSVGIPGLPYRLPPILFSQYRVRTASESAWDNFQIASYLSTNIVRVAMCIFIIEPWASRGRLVFLAEYGNPDL